MEVPSYLQSHNIFSLYIFPIYQISQPKNNYYEHVSINIIDFNDTFIMVQEDALPSQNRMSSILKQTWAVYFTK